MTRCATCGHRFVPNAARGLRFCTNRCAGAGRQRRVFTLCPGCREWVVRPWSHRGKRFCSRRCRHLATRVHGTCEGCGGRFTIPQSFGPRRFCGDACRLAWFSRAFTATASPHWQGGRIGYYGPSWRAARRAVRERDSVCQECAAEPAGEALSVAHRIPFRLYGLERHEEANALTNLVALCRRCHLRFDRPQHVRNRLLALERPA